MWDPLIQRSSNEWIGVTSEPGVWVGTEQEALARVDPDNPIFLWPLLEGGLAEVAAELKQSWERFLCAGVTPEGLLENVAVSAMDSGQSYWADLALEWVEAMKKESKYDVGRLRDAMVRAGDSRQLAQGTRHRAKKLLKDIIPLFGR
jgi:hypothetical protein